MSSRGSRADAPSFGNPIPATPPVQIEYNGFVLNNRTDALRDLPDRRQRSSFFVANLNLVDQHDAPLADLVTEWATQPNSEVATPLGDSHAVPGLTPRPASSFSEDEASPTRQGALTLLLRFARELVTELTAFLARIDQEVLLMQDSETMSSARVGPGGAWEVTCATCKRAVRFSKTARDVSCERCNRLLVRDARSIREHGELTKSSMVYCLSPLPERFADRVAPDAYLLAYVERGNDAFSPAGAKPDADGKHATVAARELPGTTYPTRQSALAAMRESVCKRLANLVKQRARLAREIS